MKRENLIRERKKQGLTQEQIANISGIKRSSYGLIETGVRNPTLKIAIKISNALGTRLEILFPNDIFFANRCYDMKRIWVEEKS